MVFRWAKEALRDTTREDLCAALCAIGVDARLAERGRLEEQSPGWSDTLGLIDIAEGPIAWVNVHRWRSENIGAALEYGVPDSRDLPEARFSSVRVRRFALFGRVIGVRWDGQDGGMGIANRIKEDAFVESTLREHMWDVRIHARPKHGCWTISDERYGAVSPSPPSAELWNCYQAIARHLLADWTRDEE